MRSGRKSYLRWLLISCILYSSIGLAAEFTGFGKINYLENGWYGEGVAIHHSTAVITGCTANSNDFAIDKNHPAYKELIAIALAAYTSESEVELIVDKGVCGFGGRTKILSIRLKK